MNENKYLDFQFFFLSILEICLKISPDSFTEIMKYDFFSSISEFLSNFLPTQTNSISEILIVLSEKYIRNINKVTDLVLYLCSDYKKTFQSNSGVKSDDDHQVYQAFFNYLSQSFQFLLSIPKYQNIDEIFTVSLFTTLSSLYSTFPFESEQVSFFYEICFQIFDSIYYHSYHKDEHPFLKPVLETIYNLLFYYPDLYFSFVQNEYFTHLLPLFYESHPSQFQIITKIFLPLFSGPFTPCTFENSEAIENSERIESNSIDFLPIILKLEIPKHLLERLNCKAHTIEKRESETVLKLSSLHNPTSSFLIGDYQPDDLINDVPQKSWIDGQMVLPIDEM